MRIHIGKSVFISLIVTLMSCTQDMTLDTPSRDTALASGEMLVSLSLSPEVETRAPRPLVYPKIAANQVNTVKIRLYKKSGDEWVIMEEGTIINDADGETLNHTGGGGSYGEGEVEWILDWENTSGEYEWNDEAGNQSHNLRLSGYKFEEGVQYKIVAYGYTKRLDGENPLPFSIEGSAESTDFTCTYSNSNDTKYNVEEVFSGRETFFSNNNGIIRVELTRQVAGFMACINEIPAKYAGNTIVLKKRCKRSSFYLNLLPDNDNVFNGCTESGVYGTFEQYEFTIPNGLKTEYKDGIELLVLEDFIFPDDMPESNKVALKNYLSQLEQQGLEQKECLFVSFFMIPDDQTEPGNAYTITIKIIKDGVPSEEKPFTISSDDDSFRFKRNYFYYLGTPSDPVPFSKILNTEV